MPRTIEVTVPAAKTNMVVRHLESLDFIAGLSLQRGGSLKPPGDIITVLVTNDALQKVFKVFDDLKVLDGGSIVTSEPNSLVSRDYESGIDRETNEAVWEEIVSLLRRETNLSNNYLLLMALAGAIATAGLWTDTIHIVVGAMIIAPGFEPLVRIPLALIGGPKISIWRGLTSTLSGYLILVAAACLCAVLLRLLGTAGHFEPASLQWVQYWSSLQPTGIIVALCAGAAGTAVVAAQRSVLSAGVMVALALVPSMAVVGLATAFLDWDTALGGLLRWCIDAVAVVVSSAVVLALKQVFIHKRHSLG